MRGFTLVKIILTIDFLHMEQNEVGPLPHILYKNQLEIDHKPKSNN